MKISNKKIPKGNILLFLSFMAVSLSLLLILSASRANRQNDLSKNSLYTNHSRNFSVSYAESENTWSEAVEGISSKYNNFAIYLPVKDVEIEARGIYIRGELGNPPMLEGTYFDQSTSWSDVPRMVLGKAYEKDTFRKNKKTYYLYEETEYEVLGIMGTEVESRLNYMMLIDFKSALKLMGINADYVLDAKNVSDISKIGTEFNFYFTSPANVTMILDEIKEEISIMEFFSGEMIMQTMFVLTLVSFFLSTVLVSFIWYRSRQQLHFLCILSGYEDKYILLEIAKRFYTTAFVGFFVGGLLMGVVHFSVDDIKMSGADLIQAFGMTVGLGTIILIILYLSGKKKI